MCDEVTVNCLTGSKFIPDWFASSKMLKNVAWFITR